MPETLLHWHTPEHPSRKPLVLLHGFMGHGGDWRTVAQKLPDFACYCPDLPGHGASLSDAALDLPDMDSVAEAMLRDMDMLGLKRCALLGYSMGGRAALHLALRQPSRFSALLVESASPGIQTEEERAQRFLADCTLAQRLRGLPPDKAPFRAFLQEWYAAPVFCTMKRREGLEALIESRLPMDTARLAAALEMMSVGKQRNLWPVLPQLPMPTLVIAGMEDRKYRQIAEKMAEANPKTALQLFSGCSHNVHWENPVGYTTAVCAFLARA